MEWSEALASNEWTLTLVPQLHERACRLEFSPGESESVNVNTFIMVAEILLIIALEFFIVLK